MKYNDKLKGKQLLKNMKRSFGFLVIFDGNDNVAEYNGCVYQKKNIFASLIYEYFDDTYRYEVIFPHIMRSIPAIILDRDPETSLTLLELQSDMCESLDPLMAAPKSEIKKGDAVFLPKIQFGDEPRSLVAGSICEIYGDFFRTNYYVDEQVLGLPLLNSSGNVIGIINGLCRLTKQERDDMDDLTIALSRVITDPCFTDELHSQCDAVAGASSVNFIHASGKLNFSQLGNSNN